MLRNASILGGQEVRWGRIVQNLGRRNSDVTILCTRSLLNAWAKAGIRPGVRMHVFEEHSSKLLTWLGAQWFAFRRFSRGDVVHVPGPGMLVLPAAIAARLIKRCTLLASLTTSRVMPLRDAPFPQRSYWVIRAATAFAHIVDALNPKIDVGAFVGDDRLSIAPCSFSDPETFMATAPKREKVVFAGHFNQQKGSELLLKIVGAWTKDPRYTLVLCGSGPYDAALREAAAGRQNIKIGRTWHVAEELADAKVFLSLQLWDNYPSQSLLEAMLCECCVVATDTGDTDLLVREPWGERLEVEAAIERYMASIIRFLEMTEEDFGRRGRAARAFIEATHTEERYLDYLEHLWNRAIGYSDRDPESPS